MERRAERVRLSADEVYRETKVLVQARLTWFQVNAETGDLELAPGAPPDGMLAVASWESKAVVVPGGVVPGKNGEPDREEPGRVVWEGKLRLWNKPEVLRLASQHLRLIGQDQPPTMPLQVNVLAIGLPSNGGDQVRRWP